MTPKSLAESGVRGIASRHGYTVESLPLSLFNLADDSAVRTAVRTLAGLSQAASVSTAKDE